MPAELPDDTAAIYPWHENTWQRFCELVDSQKLPHALLLSGSRFLGKRQFALKLAQYLLCLSPQNGERCMQCKSCLLLSANTHPDLIRVSPPIDKKDKKEKKDIPVDTIRELKETVLQTAQQGGNKVCLLQPAEKMNENSASALLKLLEEPPANTYFILVADEPHRLMPTILSRCQQQSFYKPDKKALQQWLEIMSGGADIESAFRLSRGFPGRAKQLLLENIDKSQFPGLVQQFFQGELTALAAATKLGVDEYRPFIEECQLLVHSALKNSASNGAGAAIAAETGVFRYYPGSVLLQIETILFNARRQFEANANKRLLFESTLGKCQQLLPKSA